LIRRDEEAKPYKKGTRWTTAQTQNIGLPVQGTAEPKEREMSKVELKK
jgi:hypothetical protein